MSDRDESTAGVPRSRHAAPRAGVVSRLRGRALAMAAVPTALLMGAAYAPNPAVAETQNAKGCASAPDTAIEETPVPKSEVKVAPTPGAAGTTASGGTTATEGARGTAGATGSTATRSADQAAPGSASAVSAVYSPTAAGQASGVQQAGIIGDILDGIFHPGGSTTAQTSPSPSPSPTGKTTTPPAPTTPSASSSPSASPSPAASAPAGSSGGATAAPSGTPAKSQAAKPKPSASASASADPNCQVDASGLAAKKAGGDHVVPDQNWVLHSSRLSLHGSVFNGVYDVKTPTGTKRVLKFTTDSVDIGDLDMSTIQIPGLTFHVKAAPNTTSTMRSGPITMYVESLSGHLAAIYGLPIPIDLGEVVITPDTLPKWLWDLLDTVPIPLDLTLTGAKAVQAGQFGGTLKIPGMRLFNDEAPYDG
ncbi:hypothetical protein [Kitasatospora camelliae]|uniref:Uncharacterized protein n=1 Tax=Kitasatospora camelliae TaxID=3156397 RepID=A0AAU8K1V2_9ACTN